MKGLIVTQTMVQEPEHPMGSLYRVEGEQKDNEEKFRTLLESSRDAILMMDPDGRVSYWNIAAERMFGYTSAEALGCNLHELIAPQRYHAAHHAALPEFVQTGRGAAVGKTLELQAQRKDGSEIAVALSLSAEQINDRWHAVGILRDITEQKEAQEELQRSKKVLEQTNAQLEDALEQAHRMAWEAQAANIAKSQFLANMSHEIRTPMNGIIGMTELLLDTELSTEQRRYAETVRSSGEALLSLINDILDFSKMEANRLEIEDIDFDLRIMLEDTAELLAVRAHEKNLEFICRIDPSLHTLLKGDPGRLRQILLNLGGNAIKFTSQGEVVIDVRLETEQDDRLKVRFEVRDTGIGIPKNKIGLLFTAFQQIDTSTTRRFGGTGLGLAIAKRLAGLLGGEVGVESVEEQGSVFWFTAVLGKQSPRERGQATTCPDLRDIHILVVDDNATNRLILAEQLSSWGVRNEEAADAARAISMLHASHSNGDPFRVVLMDMQMPEIDGEALGRVIKADPCLRDTLLVMMSSMGRRGDAQRLQSIGFSAYLNKPVKQSQLYDCLVTVLGAGDAAIQSLEPVLVTRHSIREARHRKGRILLVEDNDTNRQVALGILEKMGYRSDVATNGRDAIIALEKSSYDIVLMDVQMPVMDGFEATHAIRSGQTRIANPKIPIIAMTAHAMKGDRELCLKSGMDDYISKPIVPHVLAETIEKWLDRMAYQTQKVDTAAESTKSSAEPVIFDRSAFLSRVMEDEDLARKIIDGFLTDIPGQIDKLRMSCEQGDVESAIDRAHTIKGAAANVSALNLSAVALKMEKAGKRGQRDDLINLIPELERQFCLARAQMQERGS